MQLKRVILNLLMRQDVDARWYRAYFHEALCRHLDSRIPPQAMWEALWQLVGEGLVYVDTAQTDTPQNWAWRLSKRGRRVAEREQDFEPDDPESYLARLRTRLPDLDDDVLTYTTEALRSFGARCYLAASVMLGVASEKAFLLMAEAAVKWLPSKESAALAKVVQNDRNHFLIKFTEFRKRLEPNKPKLPPELADNLGLTLDTVADLLRIYRNESGHPTGRRVDREDARMHLAIFPTYLGKIWSMKDLFEGSP